MRAWCLLAVETVLGPLESAGRGAPETRGQKVGFTKRPMSLLPCRSRRSQAGRRPSPEIRNAEDRGRARAAFTTFAQVYGARLPRAVKEVTDDQGQLVAFWDVPAVLWVPLRTTAPMESSAFLTVGPRAVVEVEGGPGSCIAVLAMGFEGVQARGSTPSRVGCCMGSVARQTSDSRPSAFLAGQLNMPVARDHDTVPTLPYVCSAVPHVCSAVPLRLFRDWRRSVVSPCRFCTIC